MEEQAAPISAPSMEENATIVEPAFVPPLAAPIEQEHHGDAPERMLQEEGSAGGASHDSTKPKQAINEPGSFSTSEGAAMMPGW
jgi:hypothetical protein